MKRFLYVMFILVMVCGFAINSFANTVYDGVLTNSNGVVATDPWGSTAQGGFSVSWDITKSGNIWHYSYTFSDINGGYLPKNISHVILQVSDNFTINDISNVTGASLSYDSPKTYDSGVSNPNMPSSIYGLKFDSFDNAALMKISFDSTRSPMFGDFYTRDGKSNGIFVTAWNQDFGTDGLFKIGVPDTKTPVPSSVFLFSTGVIGILISGKRKRKC
jgi:hypothetical protein